MLSKHAEMRMRQRGFHKLDVELVLALGLPENAPGGATKYRLSGKRVREVIRSLNRIQKGAVAVVVAGQIDTLYKHYDL